MTDFYDNVKTSVLLARVIALSIGDYFSRPMLTLSLLGTLIAILFWSIIYLLFHNKLSAFSHDLISYVPFATVSWIGNIASMVLLIALFYQLVLMSVIISIVFSVKKIVVPINEKHYRLEINEDGAPLDAFLTALKLSVLFIILYFLLLPTLFIPGINVAVHLALWGILLRGTLLPYIGNVFLDSQQYSKLVRQHRWGIMAMCILLSLLYLIPVVGAFTAVFQLIVVIHYLLSRAAEANPETVSK